MGCNFNKKGGIETRPQQLYEYILPAASFHVGAGSKPVPSPPIRQANSVYNQALLRYQTPQFPHSLER